MPPEPPSPRPAAPSLTPAHEQTLPQIAQASAKDIDAAFAFFCSFIAIAINGSALRVEDGC